ncbi:sulfur carrier protein ThiS [Cypionkella psychrotolerans]|uniref:sulfur carrier protein ThiS n=1 Tax=Cypionkella psychrotolerans TaxID=1678131 RepID=UPI0006B3FFC8|nr:sulfur carrier protein ThiS [Cypionkella psychrotolerans]
MQIDLNGRPQTITATTLAAALTELGLTGPLATAVNGLFVAGSARAITTLNNGDRVEALSPMQGG